MTIQEKMLALLESGAARNMAEAYAMAGGR